VITLYDADRCPYCARVRIVLAEKGVEYETVEVDLDDRPAWIYEKNPLGRVPVLEEDAFVLPESAVINEYLEERYPDPALWPADAAERAFGRLLVFRFDQLSKPYYALRRGDDGAAERLIEINRDAFIAKRPAEQCHFAQGRKAGLFGDAIDDAAAAAATEGHGVGAAQAFDRVQVALPATIGKRSRAVGVASRAASPSVSAPERTNRAAWSLAAAIKASPFKHADRRRRQAAPPQ